MQQYIREEFQHTNDISKSILYWEIALNLSNIGKTHNFSKNNNLVFSIDNSGWFASGIGGDSPWCSVTSVTFDYAEGKKFDTPSNIDVDFKNGDKHWSIIDANGNSLFTSWTLFGLSKPTDVN
jgi:hypothetical protein